MPIEARYDADALALYVRLGEAPVASSVEIDEDFVVDLDDDSTVVGIEVLAPPVSWQQFVALASRFGFEDRAALAWTEIQSVQPGPYSRPVQLDPLPIRSGTSFSLALMYQGLAPVAVGASSANLEIDAHEFALAE